MADACERFGAGKLFAAQVDLGLKPELDPVVAERLGELDPRCDRGWMPELELLHDPYDGGGVERLLQDRQHLQPMLVADALDMLKHGCTASAHELDEAEIAALA